MSRGEGTALKVITEPSNLTCQSTYRNPQAWILNTVRVCRVRHTDDKSLLETLDEGCLGVQGEALAHMQELVQQAVGQDWRPLPQALHKAAAFQEAVHNMVFDVLMDKVCPLSNSSSFFTTTQVLTIQHSTDRSSR